MKNNKTAIASMVDEKYAKLSLREGAQLDKIQVNVRFDSHVIYALDKLALELGESRSSMATDLIVYGVHDALKEAFDFSSEDKEKAFWLPFYEENPSHQSAVYFLGEERWKELNGVKK